MKIRCRSLLALGVVLFACQMLVACESEHSVTILDVTKSHDFFFSDIASFPFNAHLSIRVTGFLDGDARIGYGSGESAPLEATHKISEGAISFTISEAEWWGSSCYIQYFPGSARSGNLRIEVTIGS